MDVLRFIFQNEFHLIGTLVLLFVNYWGIAKVLRSCHGHG